MDIGSELLVAIAAIAALFVAYNALHYVLFFLAVHPKDAGQIGDTLNEFEERQLVEWRPTASDFLKHALIRGRDIPLRESASQRSGEQCVQPGADSDIPIGAFEPFE